MNSIRYTVYSVNHSPFSILTCLSGYHYFSSRGPTGFSVMTRRPKKKRESRPVNSRKYHLSAGAGSGRLVEFGVSAFDFPGRDRLAIEVRFGECT